MSKPLVSIILPVYNAQNHIARCLESICAQSWQNIEVIVLNDGSKDQSLPVCEAFRAKDERIVLVDKANSGVSDTRNLGLKLASGKYVQFVDSDDYIDPDFTEHLVTAAEQNHADLVIAPYKMVIPAGATKPEQVLDKLQDELGVMTVARPPEVREYGFLPAGVYTQDEFARHLMDKPASYFYGGLWNKLYAHELITAEIMDNGLAYNEDLVANWQIFSAADGCAYVDFAGYHYRQHAASASHRALPPESIDQQRQAAVFIREHASPAIQQSANAFYYEKLVYLASMILRRDDAAAYRVQINELGVGIRAGLQDPNLGRNPRLPLAIRAAAWATINCPVLWRKVCRTMLKDRR